MDKYLNITSKHPNNFMNYNNIKCVNCLCVCVYRQSSSYGAGHYSGLIVLFIDNL